MVAAAAVVAIGAFTGHVRFAHANDVVDCAQVKCVALTFDDGPTPYTDRLLDILTANKAKATFFEIGNKVAANPAAEGAAPAGEAGVRRNWGSLLDLVVDHWTLAVLALAALAALGWITPRVAQAMAAGYRHRREAYLRSETFAFRRLGQAVRRGDANAAYFAMLDWLQRFDPVAPLHTVQSLKSAAQDPELDRQIGRNLGIASPSPAGSQTTSTGWPTWTESGSAPTTLVITIGPSSSCT